MSKRRKVVWMAIVSGALMFQFAGCIRDVLFQVAPFIV